MGVAKLGVMHEVPCIMTTVPVRSIFDWFVLKCLTDSKCQLTDSQLVKYIVRQLIYHYFLRPQ